MEPRAGPTDSRPAPRARRSTRSSRPRRSRGRSSASTTPTGSRARELEYELSIGLDLLGPLPVDRVDEQAVEDMVDALIDTRLAIEHARELGEPLMESYVDSRTGRPTSVVGAGCRTRRSTARSAPTSAC